MNHDQLKNELAAYLDGELMGDARAALDRHLSACGECRETLEAWRRDAALFPPRAVSPTPFRFVESVMERIEAEKPAPFFFWPNWPEVLGLRSRKGRLAWAVASLAAGALAFWPAAHRYPAGLSDPPESLTELWGISWTEDAPSLDTRIERYFL